MEIIIKKVGDKLKALRKKLGFKQEELVKYALEESTKDKPFTRNLVSMVETDKSPLTKKLAATIHRNLLILCEERNIDCDFDFEEICKTPEQQIIDYIDNYKTKLSSVISLEESLRYADKLIPLAEQYELLCDLFYLYTTIGDMCFENEPNISLKFLMKAHALKSQVSANEIIDLICRLKNLMIRLNRYEEALELSYIKDDYTDTRMLNCMYNDILCMKKLELYDRASIEIPRLKKVLPTKDTEMLTRLLMVEANIHLKRKDYRQYLKLNEYLLSISEKSSQHIYIKSNLLSVKISMGIITEKEINEFEEETLNIDVSPVKKTLINHTLHLGYERFDTKKSVEYLVRIFDSILSLNDVSNQNKVYFNTVLGDTLDDPKMIELISEHSALDLKIIVITGLSRNLLTEGTLLRALLHYQNNKEYDFVTSILEKKVS